MKRTITALLIITAILCAATLAACAQATASQEPEKPATEFHYVHDWAEPKVPSGMVRIKQEMDAKAAETAQEALIAEQADSQPEYWDGNYYSGSYDESLNNNPAYIGGGDGFAFEGVREYNGRTESWYSSNQAYHYRTGEWTADDEGYYRDSEGYYVVASEDHAEGEVFDTSKGKAKVYDGGCDSGVTDFYTAF